MSEDKDDEILEARPPSARHLFLVEWAEETEKRNLPFTNEVLRQFVTINSAMLGGAAMLLRGQVNGVVHVLCVLAFLLALAFAVWGVMPYRGSADTRIPAEIERHKDRALQWKERRLLLSALFLFAGLLCAVSGFVLAL